MPEWSAKPHRPSRAPGELHLSVGGDTRHRVEGGIHRTVNGMHHRDAVRHAPFAWFGLMNCYASRRAELYVEGLAQPATAFASATDLGTGLERPLPVAMSDGALVIRYPACPPRTLLRIYWPLHRVA